MSKYETSKIQEYPDEQVRLYQEARALLSDTRTKIETHYQYRVKKPFELAAALLVRTMGIGNPSWADQADDSPMLLKTRHKEITTKSFSGCGLGGENNIIGVEQTLTRNLDTGEVGEELLMGIMETRRPEGVHFNPTAAGRIKYTEYDLFEYNPDSRQVECLRLELGQLKSLSQRSVSG